MKPYQFIGYWGYGSEDELSVLLNQVETLQLNNVKTFQATFLHSRVIYIGNSFPTFPPNTIAGISASGISTSFDAWVNLSANNSLILAREPFGRVPLYWTQRSQVIWFASQLQLLLPILESPEISIPGLYAYSCFSYVPTPLTPVKKIFAVPAGTELIWQSDSSSGKIFPPQSKSIYPWRESPKQITDEDIAVSQLQTLIKKCNCKNKLLI